KDSRLCTDCHAQLRSLKKNTTLANVADFGTDHPDFHLTLLERAEGSGAKDWKAVRASPGAPKPAEHSGLTFSHAEHLKPKGIKSPQGYEVLSCGSCHQPNSSGRQMLPIRMES